MLSRRPRLSSLYNPASGSVIISRDVVFVEDQFVDSRSRLSRHRVGEGELSALFPDAGVRIPLSSTGGSAGADTRASDEKKLLEADEMNVELSPAVVQDDDADDSVALGDDEVNADQIQQVESDDDAQDYEPLSHLLSHHQHHNESHISVPARQPALISDPVVQPRRSNRGGGFPSSRAHDAAAAAQTRHMQRATALTAAIDDVLGVHDVINEPLSFQQAMQCADSDKWRLACMSEMDSIARAGTWELVPLPIG